MLPLRAFAAGDRHKVAIAGDNAALTGDRLDHESAAVADVLARLGVRPRDRVAVMLGNTVAFARVFLALMKLRASAVFINAQWTAREVAESLARSGAAAVVGAPSLGTRLAAVPAVAAGPPAWTDAAGTFALWRTVHSAASAGPDELMVQFTSGAAGRAKVVPRTVANLAYELDRFAACWSALSEDAVTVCMLPLSHSYGLLNGLLMPLFTARPTVPLEFALAPNAIVRRVQRYRAEVLVGVPALYRGISEAHGATAAELSSLRFCFSAGSPLPEAVFTSFTARFGRRINQQYGSTETGVIAVNLDDSIDPLSVGRPVTHGEVTVLRDDGSCADAGEIGQVVVDSKATTAGYIDDPDLTASHFKNGVYFTGDLACADARGALSLHGRRSALIDVGGFKVDPLEVERVIATHDAVVECAVVPKGQRDGESIAAVVVLRRQLSGKDIQRFCRERLAAYKVPRHVAIVERLPRSLSGKVLVKELVD